MLRRLNLILMLFISSIIILVITSCDNKYDNGKIVVEDGVLYQYVIPIFKTYNGNLNMLDAPLFDSNNLNLNDKNKPVYHAYYPVNMLDTRNLEPIDESNFRELTSFGYKFDENKKLNSTLKYYDVSHLGESFDEKYKIAIDYCFKEAAFWVVGVIDNATSITIKSEINGVPVAGIGYGALHGLELSKIEIESVEASKENKYFHIMPYAISDFEVINAKTFSFIDNRPTIIHQRGFDNVKIEVGADNFGKCHFYFNSVVKLMSASFNNIFTKAGISFTYVSVFNNNLSYIKALFNDSDISYLAGKNIVMPKKNLIYLLNEKNQTFGYPLLVSNSKDVRKLWLWLETMPLYLVDSTYNSYLIDSEIISELEVIYIPELGETYKVINNSLYYGGFSSMKMVKVLDIPLNCKVEVQTISTSETI